MSTICAVDMVETKLANMTLLPDKFMVITLLSASNTEVDTEFGTKANSKVVETRSEESGVSKMVFLSTISSLNMFDDDQ